MAKAQYSSFYDAWKAKQPVNAAAQTWDTKGTNTSSTGLQNLADAYSAKNPTWTPTGPRAGDVAVSPVGFNPYGDVGYSAQASQNINTVDHAQNYHDYSQGSGEQNFGYGTNGQLIGEGQANYNPYSQAAVLQRNYDNTKRGTTNSYAAQGQLYSGALLNKQADDAFGYSRADDSLKRGASDFYHQNDYSLTNTKDNADNLLSSLLGPAFDRFMAGQKGY